MLSWLSGIVIIGLLLLVMVTFIILAQIIGITLTWYLKRRGKKEVSKGEINGS